MASLSVKIRDYCRNMFRDSRLDNLDVVSTSLCRTPLHTAVLSGDIKFAKNILSSKPDLAMTKDNRGWTPLHLASAGASLRMVKLLLKAKPDACMVKDEAERTPLHLAAMNDRVEIMEVLMVKKLEAIQIKNGQNGDNILHFCVKSNTNTKPLRLLVKKLVLLPQNPIPNSTSITSGDKNNDGKTILQLAADLGKIEMIQYLVENLDIKFEVNDVNEALNTLIPADRKDLETRFLECLGPGNKKLNNKTSSKSGNEHEGMKEWTNTLMVVATLIAGIAFQAAMNPPGGFWQDDSKVDSGKDPITFTYYLKTMYGYTITCSLDSYLQEGCNNINAVSVTVDEEPGKGYSNISFIPQNATQYNVSTLDNAKAFVNDLISTIWSEESPSDLYMLVEGLILKDFNSTKVVSNYSSSNDGDGGSFFPYIMRYAGYPILAYTNPRMYMIYMTTSGVAFVMSLSVILLAICGFMSDASHTQARFLGMLMCISIVCVASSYVCIIVTMLPGFYTFTVRSSVSTSYTVVCGIFGFGFFIWTWISKVVKQRKRRRIGKRYGDVISVSAPPDKDSLIVVSFVLSAILVVMISGLLLSSKLMFVTLP